MEELAQIMARHHIHPSRCLELSYKIKQILVASAKQSQIFTREELADMISRVDKNKNGSIDLEVRI